MLGRELYCIIERCPGRLRSPQDLREAAAAGAASGAAAVPWDTVKTVVRHAQERKGADAAPSLEQVCGGERWAGGLAPGGLASAGAAAFQFLALCLTERSTR